MVLALQIVLVVLALGIALVLLALVAQLGRLLKRIPEPATPVSGALAPGDPLPQRSFVTALDPAAPLAVPFAGSGRSLLLFASFSCATCVQVLRSLRDLPPDLRGRLALFMLDGDAGKRFRAEIAELGLERLALVDAVDLAPAFKINAAPQAYVVDDQARVLRAVVIQHPHALKDLLNEV